MKCIGDPCAYRDRNRYGSYCRLSSEPLKEGAECCIEQAIAVTEEHIRIAEEKALSMKVEWELILKKQEEMG